MCGELLLFQSENELLIRKQVGRRARIASFTYIKDAGLCALQGFRVGAKADIPTG
jgi:hypothetical protein